MPPHASNERVGGGMFEAWGGMFENFDFNFSKMTWIAFINSKLQFYFQMHSAVAIGSSNSPSLNWNIVDCSTTDINL